MHRVDTASSGGVPSPAATMTTTIASVKNYRLKLKGTTTTGGSGNGVSGVLTANGKCA